MNEKLSFQNIVDSLSQKADVSKKVSETFSKAFFDTIVEALYMGEESIKIKGLGTFKLVEVEDRESINVTNGERFVISGYKKVAFVPDDSIVERLNAGGTNAEEEKDEVAAVAPVDENIEKNAPVNEEVAKDAPVAEQDVASAQEAEAEGSLAVQEELVAADAVSSDAVSSDDTAQEVSVDVAAEAAADAKPSQADSKIEASLMNGDIDELIEVPEPNRVEIPANPLFGIDMLISTPESIEEVREQYKEAKEKFDKAVEAAKAANMEKTRLEILLQHLESNSAPEVVDESVELPAIEEATENIAAVAESAADVKIVERVTDFVEVENTLADTPAENPSIEAPAPFEEEMAADDAPLSDAGEQMEEPAQDASDNVEGEQVENKDDSVDDSTDGGVDAAVESVVVAPSVEGLNEAAQPSPQEEPAEKTGGEALERLLSDRQLAEEDNNKEKPKKDYSTLWIISIFVAIVLGVIGYLLYQTSVSIESVEQVQTEKIATPPVNKVQNTKPKAEKKGGEQSSAANAADQAAEDNTKQAAGANSDNKASQGENKKEVQRTAPKTYTIKKGDSLTRISQQFYNTKDSVAAIIRVNKFKDPNNVPIGEVINLP